VRVAAAKLDDDVRLGPSLRAELLGTLSAISYSSSDYAQAVDLAEKGSAVLSASGDGESREALALDTKRASALISLGRAEKGDRLLGERIAAMRSVADEVAVDGLDAYAEARLQMGHSDEARELAKASAETAVIAYGRGSEKSLIARASYGDFLAAAGFNQEAAEVLEPILAQWRASTSPPGHPFANSTQNLAAAKYQLGDISGAERLVREALALWRHPRCAA
jgi:hypothetical protein